MDEQVQVDPSLSDTVVVKREYLMALEAVATAAQDHEKVKSDFWPKEKALLQTLKDLRSITSSSQ